MDVRAQIRHWRLRNNRTACILDGIDVFSGCTVRQLRLIAQLVCPISVTRGRVLVRAGERCNQLIFVLAGEGEHDVLDSGITRLGPGSLVGEAAAVPDSFEAGTATATTPMEILVASRGELVKIMRVAPAVERRLLARIDARSQSSRIPRIAARPVVNAGRREAEIAHALRALRQGVG